MAPKSILKNTLPSQSASKSRADRNLDLALHHARLIQHRKDMEALILSSTETLLDFPSSSTVDPADPSSTDESRALAHLQPFCPSDLDSLIEERNIDHRCGYMLCPRQNRKEGTSAKYRILRGSKNLGEEMKIVAKAELERWCSDECGKRALYLRVQLNDTPAWERAGGLTGVPTLKILKSSNEDPVSVTRDTGTNVDVVTQQLKQLALERGDMDETILASLLKATILESHTGELNTPRVTMTTENADRSHCSVEGYTPRLREGQLQKGRVADERDDVMDTI